MRRFISILSAYITYLISSYFSKTFLITLGCGKLHISALSCMASVAGLSLSSTAGFSLVLLKKMLTVIFSGHFVLATSLYIPTLCASLYWSSQSWFVRCGIPFLCMIAFLVHPVGFQAGWYSTFWLIPMILYCIPGPTIVSDALGSAFTAHAVGSVLWLYTLSTTPEYWYMLMPVVLYERFIIAGCMIVARMLTYFVERSVKACVAFLYKLPHCLVLRAR